MDPRLLDYYNRELQFVREMGAEFAQAYPRIAARLGMDGLECADPYVERLLEGFAFLTARVQLKLDARHPDFTQHLLEVVYPHFLNPTPSCAIIELMPDLKEGSLQAGHRVPRNTSLRSPLQKGERTACELRTAHDVTLWPITVTEAKYLSGSGALSSQGISVDGQARTAIRLRLKVAGGLSFKALPLDSLTFHLKATPDIAHRILEQVVADCVGVYVRSTRQGSPVVALPAGVLRQVGLDDSEALLPVTRQSFQGYRLLQEYFSFPERFLFFSLNDLRRALRDCDGEEIEIFLAMSRTQSALENSLDASHFRLHCTPAINLFPRVIDRVHVTPDQTEYHLVPDRNRPMDFEIYSIQSLEGVAASGESIARIRPLYSLDHGTDADSAYYTLQRRPRLMSTRQQQTGARSGYIGTECFVSLVDAARRSIASQIRQLDGTALCTNRDLPVQLATGQSRTDFTVEGGGPLEAVRCIAGPSYPRQSPAFGDTAWKLISHLSLNYLSLLEQGADAGAGGGLLRDMLALYADANDAAARRQVEGVRSISYAPVVRRIPIPGPISYGRGLQIVVTLDDTSFEGASLVALGSVLERFFARYVSLNSFTQMQLKSSARGTIKTWPVRVGCRQTL